MIRVEGLLSTGRELVNMKNSDGKRRKWLGSSFDG